MEEVWKIKEVIKRMFSGYITQEAIETLLDDIDDNPECAFKISAFWFFQDEMVCDRRKLFDVVRSYYEILRDLGVIKGGKR